MVELTDWQKKVNAAALHFIDGHTPTDIRPTFEGGDMEYLAFWREVEAEIKRLGKRTAIIPEWYKLGWY